MGGHRLERVKSNDARLPAPYSHVLVYGVSEMVRLNRMPIIAVLAGLALACCMDNTSFGQSERGIRTPLRSTIQTLRPKNWRIFQSPAQAPAPQSIAVCEPGSNCSAGSVLITPPIEYSQVAQSFSEVVPQSFASPPVVAPETIVASSADLAESTTVTALASERSQFREQIIKASRQAYRANEITLLELLKVSRAANNPAKLEEMHRVSRDAAFAEGLATTQAIDWDALFAFLEKLLPLLLQLFG
jgi:hypothetical protein